MIEKVEINKFICDKCNREWYSLNQFLKMGDKWKPKRCPNCHRVTWNDGRNESKYTPKRLSDNEVVNRFTIPEVVKENIIYKNKIGYRTKRLAEESV